MTREQIEKAALLFAGAGEWGECPYNPDAKNGFMAGARWRVNVAWHDPREESPFGFKLMLLQDENGEIDLGYMLPPNITRWAYVADLLPDDGKEGGR